MLGGIALNTVRSRQNTYSSPGGSPRPEYFLDIVDPKIIDEEAVQMQCFQAWVAYRTLRKRIDEALGKQEAVDNGQVLRKNFLGWKQVYDIVKTRNSSGLIKTSVLNTPVHDMHRIMAPVHDWQGPLVSMAAHRKAIGAKLLIEVRRTLAVRVVLVAWRAYLALQKIILQSDDGAVQILHGGGRGWTAQQWHYRVINVWTPQRVKRKYFSEWQMHIQRKIRTAIRRKMMLKSGLRLVPRMERPRHLLLQSVVFNKWAQHAWVVHADSVYQQERERMQQSYQRRLLEEQQRSRIQQNAVKLAREKARQKGGAVPAHSRTAPAEAERRGSVDSVPSDTLSQKKFRLPKARPTR